jgi:hypothetical protein
MCVTAERFWRVPSGTVSVFKRFWCVPSGINSQSSIREWKVSSSSRETMTNAGMSNSQYPSLTELQLMIYT